MIRISVDFDGCLSEKHVQNTVRKLIAKGHDVYILTSRNDGIIRIDYSHVYGTNEVVYQVASEAGVKPWKICFTNQIGKAKYLANTKIQIHIDNDPKELEAIRSLTKVKGFNSTLPNFEETLWEYLENIENF